MEAVAAAWSCRLLLLMLVTVVMLLPGTKVLLLLVQRIARTIVLQESIGKVKDPSVDGIRSLYVSIENVKGQLRPNQKALKVLSSITQPVVVVAAIVGLYRTGKSYLMNKLAGKNMGFSLGSTIQSHTKGIWMWCMPHPQKPGHTLVMLDTEGLGDVEKGSNQNDCWIFALSVLLSITFVYNSMGAINQQAMDSCSTSKEAKNYNLPRLCIRKFFPKKKCFVFCPPTGWKKLSKLENLHSDELDSDFVQQAAEFCSFILSSSKAKTLPGGIGVTGTHECLVQSFLIALERPLFGA